MLLSWIYAIVVAVVMVITIIIIYVIDKMKRGIDPMPAFVAALMTPSVMASIAKNVNSMTNSTANFLSEPLGYRNTAKEDMITLPGIHLSPNNDLTLPGFFPQSQEQK